MMQLLRDARLVCAKDLRIEIRARIVIAQVLPFGALVLILFAFTLDADSSVLPTIAPGLFWITVLLSSILAVGRSMAIETDNGARDGLRLSAMDGGSIFLGKVGAVVAELLVLEVLLLSGTFALYDIAARGWLALIATSLAATIGIAATGAVYGALAAGAKVRETLVPLLVLPVCAPVLLGATKAFESALHGRSGEAWPWIQLLGVFAALYLTAGFVAYEALLEEA